MTHRKSNARPRLPGSARQKSARASRALLTASTRGKQEQPSVNVPLASAQPVARPTQGEVQNKPDAPASANPVSEPRPFNREKEKTMSVKEAAFRLKKHEDTVYLWLRTGRLRGWQVGGPGCAVQVEAASVEEALVWRRGTGGQVRTATH